MKQKSLKLWHAVSAWGILIILLLLFIDSMTDFTSTERIKNRMKENKENKEAFIGKPEIEIKDGVFTPEAMLAMGRLSDPQVSPDGTKILYGVSLQQPLHLQHRRFLRTEAHRRREKFLKRTLERRRGKHRLHTGRADMDSKAEGA